MPRPEPMFFYVGVLNGVLTGIQLCAIRTGNGRCVRPADHGGEHRSQQDYAELEAATETTDTTGNYGVGK